jgi:hypothetical protein
VWAADLSSIQSMWCCVGLEEAEPPLFLSNDYSYEIAKVSQFSKTKYNLCCK